MNIQIRLAVLALAAVLLSACASFWSWEAEKPAPPPRVAGPDEHAVILGDTMYSIAFRNQLDYRELARWNNVGSDYLIVPGQILRLTPLPGLAAVAVAAEPEVPQTSAIVTEGVEMPVSMGRPMPLPPETGIAEPQPQTPTAPTAPRIAGTFPTAPPRAANIPATAPPAPAAAAPVPAVVAPAPAVVATAPSSAMVVASPPKEQESVAHHPWQVPTQGTIVRAYAPDRGSKGLDFTGAVGQPVVATAAGKVVYSGSALRGYGELVIIKHDDLRLSAYGYNQRRLVSEGDVVRAGQQIAELGLGPENKPVLHFEIRERGKPVNPTHYLPPGIPTS